MARLGLFFSAKTHAESSALKNPLHTHSVDLPNAIFHLHVIYVSCTCFVTLVITSFYDCGIFSCSLHRRDEKIHDFIKRKLEAVKKEEFKEEKVEEVKKDRIKEDDILQKQALKDPIILRMTNVN